MSRIVRVIMMSLCSVAVLAANAEAQSSTVTIQANQPGAVISSNLFGIFFEEINSAGDGGLYAELVRNRSFEDSTNSLPYWSLLTEGTASGTMALDTSRPLSAANPHYLKLTMTGGLGAVGVANDGYWGIPVSAGATYHLGLYARAGSGFTGSITASLEGTNSSAAYASDTIGGLTTNWQHFEVSLVPTTTDPSARLALRIAKTGSVYLDFVSLFPAKTFMGRTNGLQPDLANMLVHLKPSFMRFPGGSWVDGINLSNAYHWERTIGDPANRIERTNIWGYMVSNGLGYEEYLQLCEDLHATPVFCINAGMAGGQAVAPADLGPWVQEALNAIEYANGSTNTDWGAQRAANGHPAPFHLHYIEIGNENGGSAYNANYAKFYDAIKSHYPDMHIIADDWGGIPSSRPVEIMDQHYYNSASWFVQNAHLYDNYSRTGPKVFVGEYAVAYKIGPGFPANLQNALGEAAWMTGLERNSDVVKMACYAPLFANVHNEDWTPDLIYFDGTRVYGTPSYYVQEMFSQNRGDVVLPASVDTTASGSAATVHGAIGLGSWNTSVEYTNVVVSSNGVTLYRSDFSSGAPEWRVYNGNWSTQNGVYRQTDIATDCYSTTGNTNWANYTITLQARKVSGDEGFLILFNWLNDHNWTWWNIGGWGNTEDAIEQMAGGSKSLISNQVSESINTGQWYDIRIVLTGSRIQCYLDGRLIHDITYPSGILVSSSYAKASGQVIVKAVNPYSQAMPTTFDVKGVDTISPSGTLIRLAGSPGGENSFNDPTRVFPVTNSISNASTNFTLTLPADSLSILRLRTSGINTYTNLQLQINSRLSVGQTASAVLWGWEKGQTTPDNLTADTNHAITWSSSDTDVALVDTEGQVTAVGPGATAIVATYASLGLSATQTVQVVGPPNTLAHRYSFNEPAGSLMVSDSVGGSAWNGTLPNGGTFANGQLTLNSASQQYVQLPPDILSNYAAVTIEAWVTFPDQLPVNCFFYGFGNTDSSGAGEDYLFCAPQGGRIAITAVDPGWQGEQEATGAGDLSYRSNLHFVAVYDPPAGSLLLYTNGVLAAVNNAITVPMSSVNDVLNYIGRSLYNTDPYPDLVLNEFRIYSGALNSKEITATQALGPNQLLTTSNVDLRVSIGSNDHVALSWPVAAADFTLQSRTNLVLGNWSPVVSSGARLVGDRWQETLPLSGKAAYFRLAQ